MPEHRTGSHAPAAPRLLDRLRGAIRMRHYSPRTSEAYVFWVRKFVVFHGKRHPDTMGASEVDAFLTHLAVSRNVAASTQNQALAALLFLYRQVLGREIDAPKKLVRAKRSVRVPVALSPSEIAAVLRHLQGLPYLAVLLMYGSGLRLQECLQLRVQDIDFDRLEVVVRQGKGQKDRHTLLPAWVEPFLRAHLTRLQQQHAQEAREGIARVAVPDFIARRSSDTASEWGWQWVFPARRAQRPLPGSPGRRPFHKSAVQRAFRLAVTRSGIWKTASCHSLRHSFAMQLLDASYNIRTIQELMGHKDVSTTMVYTHPLNRGGRDVRSPFDDLPKARVPDVSRPESK